MSDRDVPPELPLWDIYPIDEFRAIWRVPGGFVYENRNTYEFIAMPSPTPREGPRDDCAAENLK